MTRYSLGVRQNALLTFAILNGVAAGLHAQRFLFVAGPLPAAPGLVFGVLALLAQASLATLGLHAVLAAVALADVWALVTAGLAAVAFTLLHTFTYIDARIYGFFRFHFNALALNVLLTPGGFESMELPRRDLIAATAGIAILLGIEIAAYVLILRRGPARPRHVRRPWFLFGATVVGLVAAERLTYLAGDLLEIPSIVSEARVIPFYEPLRLREVRQRLQLPRDVAARTLDPTQSGLNYPREPVVGSVSPDHRWNVVWIVVESWRA